MNYIKEAEKYLYYYRDLYKSIERMNDEIGKLKWDSMPKGYSSSIVENTGGRSEQDTAYNILFKLQNLIRSRNETEEKLKDIDEILEGISKDKDCEFYGDVLRKWYIERIDKETLAKEFGYSSKQSIYTLKGRAIRKFAVRLFGLDLLKTM